MKKIMSLLIIGAMMTSMMSCTSTDDTGTGTTSQADITSNADTTSQAEPAGSSSARDAITTDLLGNEITLPDSVDRIVSLAPSFTEILIDVGLGSNIVGADMYSLMTTSIDPSVTEFNLLELDLEILMTLKPDVIFVSDLSAMGGEDPLAQLRDMGICVIATPSCDDLESIYSYVQYVGDVVFKTDEAKELVTTMQTEIAKIAEISSTITEKKTVLFEISGVPFLYSFGTGVFLDEVITISGGINALEDQQGWVFLDEESAVNLNPDVILTSVNYIEDSVGEIMSRVGWEEVTAVKNGDVYYIDNQSSSNGNHTVYIAIAEVAKALYPDKF